MENCQQLTCPLDTAGGGGFLIPGRAGKGGAASSGPLTGCKTRYRWLLV